MSHTQAMSLARIAQQGYNACNNGKSEDANPYKLGSAEHSAWANGWLEAFTENL